MKYRLHSNQLRPRFSTIELSTHQGTSTDIDAQQLLECSPVGRAEMNDALVSIVEQGDQRFISGLIELMRAGQIGLVRSVNYPALIEALESLSGQQFG